MRIGTQSSAVVRFLNASSLRSGGWRRQCSALARQAHRPAVTSRRSLRACDASSASSSSKGILQVGPLQGKDQKAQTKSPRFEIWGYQLRKWISYQNL